MELMWCIVGEHEVPRNGFTRPASGLESTEMCNPCYFQGLDQEEQEEENDDDVRSRASSVSSYQPSSRHNSVASELGRFTMSSSPAGSRSNSPAPARVLDTTDPPIDFSMQNNDAEAPALSEQDWQYLKDFQARLAKEVVLDHCTRCKETWFNNNVVNGVCKKCRTTRDKSKKDDEPFLMSAENLMVMMMMMMIFINVFAAMADLPKGMKTCQARELLQSPIYKKAQNHEGKKGNLSTNSPGSLIPRCCSANVNPRRQLKWWPIEPVSIA
jgi:hypothetical protein